MTLFPYILQKNDWLPFSPHRNAATRSIHRDASQEIWEHIGPVLDAFHCKCRAMFSSGLSSVPPNDYVAYQNFGRITRPSTAQALNQQCEEHTVVVKKRTGARSR